MSTRPGPFRALEVIARQQISPRMIRLTLGGPEFAGLVDGPNVKLLVPAPGASEPAWPTTGPDGRPQWPEGVSRPALRTFSVRRFDAAAQMLDIDFLIHPGGAASEWAWSARPGDVIGVGRPGGLTIQPAHWYLLAGDQSALPAIARILEDLPAEARGLALIEIDDAAERQILFTQGDIDIRWIVRRGLGAERMSLEHAIRGVTWPEGRVFAWVAAESDSVRAIRTSLRDERGFDRTRMLVVGYWKAGMDYRQYHDAHDHDRDEDYHAQARVQRERATQMPPTIDTGRSGATGAS